MTRYLQNVGEQSVDAPLASLSMREREVLQSTAEGQSPTQIAEVLFISRRTVVTYRSRLMYKLGLDDLPTLTKFAI
ncbi:helix-turn-helix domain-containing protein, partial [Candidatus Bipolaricaulota bacterium]|nr:helix-turn-helix domain-containing protein [Candidatus Bipolaricaulota bacterium]